MCGQRPRPPLCWPGLHPTLDLAHTLYTLYMEKYTLSPIVYELNIECNTLCTELYIMYTNLYTLSMEMYTVQSVNGVHFKLYTLHFTMHT